MTIRIITIKASEIVEQLLVSYLTNKALSPKTATGREQSCNGYTGNSELVLEETEAEQKRFQLFFINLQGTTENWRVTHQLEFCWQAIPCSGGGRGGNRKRPLAEFQTGTGMTQLPFDAL